MKRKQQPRQTLPVVPATVTRCPKCGSTDRTEYSHTTRHAIVGIAPDGHEYSHVVWRTTQCNRCGQRRRDRSYELVE